MFSLVWSVIHSTINPAHYGTIRKALMRGIRLPAGGKACRCKAALRNKPCTHACLADARAHCASQCANTSWPGFLHHHHPHQPEQTSYSVHLLSQHLHCTEVLMCGCSATTKLIPSQHRTSIQRQPMALQQLVLPRPSADIYRTFSPGSSQGKVKTTKR